MNKTILSIALLAACVPAYGDTGDIRVHVHGFSSHLDLDGYSTGEWDYSCWCAETKPFNEVNLGVGVGYELTDGIEARTGFYHNSFYTTSVYAALSMHTSYTRAVAVGLMVGGITGYDDTPLQAGVVQVMALPSLSVGTNDIRIELGYIPKLNSSSTAVVTLSFNVKY